MAILQIRDVPDELYAELKARAERERRSLSQEALVLLERAVGGVASNQARRRAVLDKTRGVKTSVEQIVQFVREDRNR